MPSLTGDDQLDRRELDADLRRHDANADAAADGDPQHHRSRARQCHRAAGQARPSCIGWSIPTPATRSWWSRRRRRSAASSSGRISSSCRCWNRSTAWRFIRTPTTSPPRSAADKVILGRPGRPDAVVGRRRGRTRHRRRSGRCSTSTNGARTARKTFCRAQDDADRRPRPPPSPISARRRGSTSPVSTWRAGCIRKPRACQSDLVLADAKPGTEEPVALIMHAVASILMGRPERGAEGPRQSGDRKQLRFAAVEGAGLCAPGQMGGCAGEIQERRIRHHRAADRPAAHRDRGRDAGLARGQGLFRRLATAAAISK